MASPSNLYAEKIFAEHPSVFWALDDQADYISLLNDRTYTDWTFGGTSSEELLTNKGDAPFPSSELLLIKGNIPTGSSSAITIISKDINNFTELNQSLATFATGSYIKSLSAFMTNVEIGYEYFDHTTGSMVQQLTSLDVAVVNKWFFVSDTFNIPSEDAVFRIVIKIHYLAGGQTPNDYQFLINGVSIGQWCEEFNSTSLGVQISSIPSNIAVNSTNGIVANAYGLFDKAGYYLAKNNSLVAKNSGIPLVFGSQNTTVLYSNSNDPSVIIPGQGFLNDLGRFKEYTIEMWVNITTDAVNKTRIFGPIASTDGLYVHGPFITFKVGNDFGSHYIGEWSKPMLLHVRVSNNNASLLINGEQVISFAISPLTLNLPLEYNAETGKHQDWLGFYAYDNVSPYMIDCVAIYPYQVSTIVAKRRFVYGQGVEFPEVINHAYGGTSVYIDYPFSKYANNYMYPDTGEWNQAAVDNLETNNGILSTPSFNLPDFIFSNKTQSNLFTDCDSIQSEEYKFITFRPNSSWDNTNAYIYYNKLNMISEETKAFYGIFKIKEAITGIPQVLIRVEDSTNNNYFSIEAQDHRIDYILKYSGTTKVIYSSPGVEVGTIFAAGINIDDFANYYGKNLLSFFGNKNQLNVYIGGTKELSNTFTGNIYKVGFTTARNISNVDLGLNFKGVPYDYEDVFEYFDGVTPIDSGDSYFGDNVTFWQYLLSGGTPSDFSVQRLVDHIASHTLIFEKIFDKLIPDIATTGYWEDNLPLTYFGKNIVADDGSTVYGLDFIQFNIDYPAPSKYTESETTGTWKYAELKSEYEKPTQKTYALLDNHLYTNYDNYDDLAQRSIKSYLYDTSNSLVRSYITFQYTKTGANAQPGYFTRIENATKNGVVIPGSDWQHTKYEVVDNMVIYPPTLVDFNDLSIVLHLEFVVNGVRFNPVKVRSLQLASQALNANQLTPIGTRFGTDVYPYTKDGFYYNYKHTNPYTIYKKSMPYLYLSRNSGFEIKGTYNPQIDRGLSIKINSSKASDYQVMAMQVFLKYDKDFFPYAPTPIFNIYGRNSSLNFYMVADSPDGRRAKIYAINSDTGRLENGIAFYINGKLVKNPVITVKEWSVLGISFANIIDYTNYTGELNLVGPLVFSNISYYQSTTLQEVKTVVKRQWFQVLNSGSSVQDWEYWVDAGNWNNVLILSTTSYYGVNPKNIYDAFAGTNKIIIDDERLLMFDNYEYNFNTDVTWQSKVINAV